MDDDRVACDAAWFAGAAGGYVASGSNAAIGRVETDSRKAGPSALFVAIRGERSDGHDYVV